MDKCKHEWYALGSECIKCGKPIEKHILELESVIAEFTRKEVAVNLIPELEAALGSNEK